MKKINLVSLAFLMSLGVCTSCGSESSKKIQLTIGFWPENTETRDVAMYNQWKEAFEADNPEYEIVAQPYTYDTTTVGSKYLTGTLPTVFQTWFTEPSKLKDKKYIRPITSILEENNWLDKMDDEMRATLTFDNEIYGIPRDGYGLGLLINLKIFYDNELIDKDANGKYILYSEDGTPLYPTTFDAIYTASQKICEYDNAKGVLICSANKNGGWQLSNMAWNYGATLEYKGENNKWMANLDSDEVVQALEWVKMMKQEDLLLNKVSIYYDEWYSSIGEKVAMAFVGSDVLQLAKTNGNVNMDDLAFVPMPSGDGINHYSLYGGTPYVFSKDATDDQVKGVLKFFEYIGRTPNVSEKSKSAMVQGFETAISKGQPILPTIKPWKNDEYVSYAKSLEDQYVTVNMDYYKDFYNQISDNKHAEEPYLTQEMYEYLDSAIQNVLSNPETANVKSLLTTQNSKLQALLDKEVNK